MTPHNEAKKEDIAKTALEKYRAKKADTPAKANEIVAKKRHNTATHDY